MSVPESSLESALRDLPPREGHPDWNDLRSRLRRRHPFRVRLARHANTFKWVSACLGILLLVGFWQAIRGQRSVTASRSQELRTWLTAHDQATGADAFVDPWSQSLAESYR